MVLEQESIKDKEKKTKKKNLKITDKPIAAKAKLIQIYPTKDQKNTLKKWFGVRRWIYNKCLDAVNKKLAKLNRKDLRDKIINNKNFQTENTWMLEYEYDLRDEALSDLLNNYKSNFAKDKSFDIKFISKKQQQSLSVLSKKWNNKNDFYSSIFKPEKIKSNEQIPEKLNYTSRLKKTLLNKYYLCIPEPLNKVGENQALGKMIFIDPGVKTFLTGYDPSGKIIQWGEKDIGVISRLLHYKRKLQSKMNSKWSKTSIFMFKSSNRRKMFKAILRINNRIYNLVNELHKKLSKWLVENYQYIFIPKLNFHKCKKLNKKSKSKMASYRHCAFVDRLKNKTREVSNTYVLEINEAYTSKTCSECGNQHQSLKNKDIYECTKCQLKIGRDINASKNVMLRYFTKRVSLDC
jgi:transposase